MSTKTDTKTSESEQWDGFSNALTYHVNLWMTNDQATFKKIRSEIKRLDKVDCGEFLIEDLAGYMEQWALAQASNRVRSGGEFVYVLMSEAIRHCVNWQELAQHWIALADEKIGILGPY